MAPVPFGLVCFRYRPDGTPEGGAMNELNRELLRGVNASGRVHLTHTELNGRFAIRLVVGQRQTQRSHVEEAWRLIRKEAEALKLSR
jgi:aromatic-L-amino-acid decarboxylase